MGYPNLLPMMRMRMKTKDIPYKQAMLAEHVKEVGAKGINVDTASPLFIASLNCEPKQHDLRAAQTLDAIKCQLTDPETKSAVAGPGGTRLVVAVSHCHHWSLHAAKAHVAISSAAVRSAWSCL